MKVTSQGLAQFGRDEDTARGIHVHIHGVTQKNAFPPLGRHGKLGNALAKFFPLGAGENHEAAVRVLGDGELARCRGRQDVTMPGRHGQPTFRIETQRGGTLKHGQIPSSARYLVNPENG